MRIVTPSWLLFTSLFAVLVVSHPLRSGRRNDKLLSFFRTPPSPSQSLKRPHNPSHKGTFNPFQHLPNSPITFIKMPPSPYQFVPGQGYVSRPMRPSFGMPMPPFSDGPENQIRSRIGSAELPDEDNIFHAVQESQEDNLPSRPKPQESQEIKIKQDSPPRPDSGSTPSKVLNFDFLSSIANVHRPKVKYVSNAKPFNVWSLRTTATTTTTTTTTTTSITTTTTTASTTQTTTHRTGKRPSSGQNSPIIWLGKFLFNGLPGKIMEFKSPFSPLYWYDSLKDIQSSSKTNQPSKKLFHSLF